MTIRAPEQGTLCSFFYDMAVKFNIYCYAHSRDLPVYAPIADYWLHVPTQTYNMAAPKPMFPVSGNEP